MLSILCSKGSSKKRVNDCYLIVNKTDLNRHSDQMLPASFIVLEISIFNRASPIALSSPRCPHSHIPYEGMLFFIYHSQDSNRFQRENINSVTPCIFVVKCRFSCSEQVQRGHNVATVNMSKSTYFEDWCA